MGLFVMWILNLIDQRAWYGLAEGEAKAGNFTAVADSEFFITVIRLCHKSVQSQFKNADHLLIFLWTYHSSWNYVQSNFISQSCWPVVTGLFLFTVRGEPNRSGKWGAGIRLQLVGRDSYMQA